MYLCYVSLIMRQNFYMKQELCLLKTLAERHTPTMVLQRTLYDTMTPNIPLGLSGTSKNPSWFNRTPGCRNSPTVQITFIFIGQTHLVFGKRVCTCVTKHSNAFRTFLNWLKNSKRVWHEPKLHIMRVPLFANFDL